MGRSAVGKRARRCSTLDPAGGAGALGVWRVGESGFAFKRSFVLSQDADAEQISARYRDGLLTVTVPKTAKARPKQITVTSGA